jgi:hypothetical protein
MSWLQKIGLIEGDPEEEKRDNAPASVSTSSTPASAPLPNIPPPPSGSMRPTVATSAPDKQFDMSVFGTQSTGSSEVQAANDPQKQAAIQELFQGILDKSNMQGMDYYEFRKALQELKSMGDSGMSEVQLYRSVHVAFKTQGCDVARLIESANFYLTTLDSEKKKIDEAISNKKEQEIGGVKSVIELIEQENVSISEQIEELRKKVTENQNRIFELQNQMDTSARSLRDREVMVNQEYVRVTDDIRSDIQRINQYLTPTTTKS